MKKNSIKDFAFSFMSFTFLNTLILYSTSFPASGLLKSTKILPPEETSTFPIIPSKLNNPPTTGFNSCFSKTDEGTIFIKEESLLPKACSGDNSIL